MSETITLIAGILLTSVGLLALLPRVLRRGQPVAAVAEGGFPARLPCTETLLYQAVPIPQDSGEAPLDVAEELEELKAGLFSLRLMVGDALAEVQDAYELLNREAAAEFSTDGV